MTGIEYRVFPTPHGKWMVEFYLTEEQSVQAANMAWDGHCRPQGPYKKVGRAEIRARAYCRRLCEYLLSQKTRDELRDETPVRTFRCACCGD